MPAMPEAVTVGESGLQAETPTAIMRMKSTWRKAK
jgi:hypothetical protein